METHHNPSPTPELPSARRYEQFPVLEGDELVHVPQRIKDEAAKRGWTDDVIRQIAVAEFTSVEMPPPPRVLSPVPGGGVIHPSALPEQPSERRAVVKADIVNDAENFLYLVRARQEIRAQLAALDAADAAEKTSGIRGLGVLLSDPIHNPNVQRGELEQALAWTTNSLHQRRDAIRAARTMTGTQQEILANVEGRHALFGLYRRADGMRKFRAYKRERAETDRMARHAEITGDALRIRQTAEDLVAAATASVPADRRPSPEEILASDLTPEIERLAERIADAEILEHPADMPEEQLLQHIREYLRTTVLTLPATVLRNRYEDLQRDITLRTQQWTTTLEDPRNSDLAEVIRDERVRALLRAYHVEHKRFLPVGTVEPFLNEMDDLVTSKRGPILRALLYGPPGTGKTEIFREIGARHGQRVRVISLHETSTFETLVGMHQIPIPKQETLADAERFAQHLASASDDELPQSVPASVLNEFAGKTPEERAKDFRGWFTAKLNATRAVAALGVVAPDDPRIRRAHQEALAAWLDQPLTEGLIAGDIIVLDEADKAGNAMEGLQDLLTRRPGDRYQPPGRPQPYRIHPDARVVMTANWGDLQTEFTGGGGRLAAPIVSRTVEIRKVDYLDPHTEMQLFEIMTSTPEGASLLYKREHAMMDVCIARVFPKLRDLYLKPGEMQLITPLSVRSLENIARRLVDETTRTRVRGRDGNPTHLVEAMWAELTKGPFREDQRDAIRERIARTMSDAGLFQFFAFLDGSIPLVLQIERLTGIPAARLETFIGRRSNEIAPSLPKDFSFGDIDEGDLSATNSALNTPLEYRSMVMVSREEDLAYRRMIEEQGGNPEVQCAYERIVQGWVATYGTWDADIRSDGEQLLTATADYITQALRDVPASSAGDLQLLYHRLPKLLESAPSGVAQFDGVLFSLAMNRHIEHLPADARGTVDIEIDAPTQDMAMDYIGFRLSEGLLTINGYAGNSAGRELAGGTFSVMTAGDKLGHGMRAGKIIAQDAGKRAGQRMRGGNIEIAHNADERLGMDMEGGTIVTPTAGPRAGFRMHGGRMDILNDAGPWLGEGANGGDIMVGSHAGVSGNCRARVRRISDGAEIPAGTPAPSPAAGAGAAAP